MFTVWCWVYRSSYCGPCVVRTAVIWSTGWCGHFGANYSPICTVEFIITVRYYRYHYYHHYYYNTLRNSISALRSFTVALSWFSSVTYTNEFPLRGPDSRFIRTSLPPPPALKIFVTNARRCFVFLTAVFRWHLTAQCHLSAPPVKFFRVDLCVLYDFFFLKPIGNYTGDMFAIRRDLKFSNFLRAWNS